MTSSKDAAATPAIRRQFATLPDGAGGYRQVLLRIAGSGPPILLLHQSPRDSRELEPLMLRLAARALVIAPDTPGYGLSDPLPAAAGTDIGAYARAVLALMDGLGIGRAALYGLHTGGCIALHLAASHPDRVAALVVDGVLLLTAAERQDYLHNYLPPFQPVWDGSHLVWAWARIREQALFFPWYRAAAGTRMARTLPPPDRMQMLVMELLRAGDHYRGAYGAALAQDVAGDISRLAVPALLMSSRDDILVTQFDRMPAVPPGIRTATPETRAVAADAAVEALVAGAAGLPPLTLLPDGDGADAPAAGCRGAFILADGVHLRIRRAGDPSGQPVLLLPDADGSSALLEELALSLAASGQTLAVAIDPPGAGDSDPLPDQATAPQEPDDLLHRQAGVIAAAARAMAPQGGWHLIGVGSGGALALALAAALGRDSAGVAGVTLLAPPSPGPDGQVAAVEAVTHAPDLTPDPQGAHLLRAWHRLRNDGVFSPWYRETADAAIARPDLMDPALLQARLVALMSGADSHRARLRAECGAHMPALLECAQVPVRIALPDGAPGSAGIAAWARAAGHPILALPPDRGGWGRLLRPPAR